MTIALDLETLGIESRPDYPPKPVGLAFAIQGGLGGYLAFGHPCENNAAPQDAAKLIHQAFRGDYGPVIFHHGHFDIDVMQTHFGVKGMPKDYHDTLFTAFLDDPRAQTLSLKPLAAKYLRRRAGERDELYDWIAANVRVDGKKVPKSQLGAYISEAPGKMVGRYAMADAEMTLKLHEKLHKIVLNRGMGPAYRRELDLVPITMEMERTGLRVDMKGLIRLASALEQVVHNYDRDIRLQLRVDDSFNVDSGLQLGHALVRARKLSKQTLTPGGKQSTAKETLIETCNDPKLVRLLSVRSAADKYLTGFVRPWVERGAKTGGYIQPKFNQCSNKDDAGKGGGTRSGRYSSSDPNFQNIPGNTEDSPNKDTLELLTRALQAVGFSGFIGLRDYFLADEGKILAAIDYSQQELRFAAHFEGGPLMAQYVRDPLIDVHKWVQVIIKERTGVEYPRKFIKRCVFSMLYGAGYRKLAQMLKISEDSARHMRNAILDALPGIKQLMATTKDTVVTWGGRVYHVEDARMLEGDPDSEGQWMTFEHKQLNYRIQGSSADYTKQGMLNARATLPECRIACQVHDEILFQLDHKDQAPFAVEAMCREKLCVPMLAEAKLSTTTWARAVGQKS